MNRDQVETILHEGSGANAPFDIKTTVVDLFEQQVEQVPNQVAISYQKCELTYRQLNQRANQLARLIQVRYHRQTGEHIVADTLIGLCMERSVEMIIGLLAILKSGAAYVPLDPDYPEDRLEYMVRDSHEGLILTQQHVLKQDRFLDDIHHEELLIIDSQESISELSRLDNANLDCCSSSGDLAYVIYTSGSTGLPKGVQQDHRGCVNRITWMQNQFKLDRGETYLHKTPIGFDVSFGEIMWPLSVGATLVISQPNSQANVEYLCEVIYERKVENIHFVPALLSVFCDYVKEYGLVAKLSSLKRVFCSGEALLKKHCQQVFELLPVSMHNLYGPTEAGEISFFSCSSDTDITGSTVPLGRPIANAQFYVLNEYLNLCPIGTPGELYIGGVGLARGYLNKEDLTAERFIPNPYADELGLDSNSRIYRTGDLVRWLDNGQMKYLGRTDFQVKIRGFRVELGEIENALAQHPSVAQAVVQALELEGQKYLVAYYILEKNNTELPRMELVGFLSQTLPEFMLPHFIMRIDHVPVTPNGKVDRRALPIPKKEAFRDHYVAPQNAHQQQLAEIWAELLMLDKIGIRDNFFALGGDSIKAISLVVKAHERSIAINVKDVFDCPTIEKLAAKSQFIDTDLCARLDRYKTIIARQQSVQAKSLYNEQRQKADRQVQPLIETVESLDVSKKIQLKSVLVTGGTGFLGAHIVFELLVKGLSVIALTRANDHDAAANRLHAQLDYYFSDSWHSYRHLLTVYASDLSAGDLSLSSIEWSKIVASVQTIIHSAANVSHYGMCETFYTDNVVATENLLQLAAQGENISFHFVSTIATCQQTADAVGELAFFTELDLPAIETCVDHVYIKTKLMAEHKVVESRQRGVNSNIYRVGNLVFNSDTYRSQINIESNAFLNTLFSAQRLGTIFDTFSSTMSCVNNTAAAICCFIDKPALHNGVYHLQNDELVPIAAYLRQLQMPGVQFVSFSDYIDYIKQAYTKAERHELISRQLLHLGWLEDYNQVPRQCVLHQAYTNALLEKIGFMWHTPTADDIRRLLEDASPDYKQV